MEQNDKAGALISPEDQIRNVTNSLLRTVDGPSFPGRQQVIRNTVHQLDETLALYFRGELPPIPVDGAL